MNQSARPQCLVCDQGWLPSQAALQQVLRFWPCEGTRYTQHDHRTVCPICVGDRFVLWWQNLFATHEDGTEDSLDDTPRVLADFVAHRASLGYLTTLRLGTELARMVDDSQAPEDPQASAAEPGMQSGEADDSNNDDDDNDEETDDYDDDAAAAAFFADESPSADEEDEGEEEEEEEQEEWEEGEMEEEPAPPRPALAEFVRALPRTTFTLHRLEACLICGDELTPESEVTVLPCGHYYCTDCTEEWLAHASTCPECRLQMPRADDGSAE